MFQHYIDAIIQVLHKIISIRSFIENALVLKSSIYNIRGQFRILNYCNVICFFSIVFWNSRMIKCNKNTDLQNEIFLLNED